MPLGSDQTPSQPDPNSPFNPVPWGVTAPETRAPYSPTGGGAPGGSGQAGNYMQRDPSGTTWLRPNGGDNTTWMYGANAPTAGVDQRAWSNIYNPLAYQYGGQTGGAGLEESRYANMASAATGRAGPQIDQGQYQADLGNAGQSRVNQQDVYAMLQRQAMGQGPSVAEAQMNAGLAQGFRNAMQTAAGARGGGANLVAAQQLASSQQGQLAQAAIGQGAIARAQEQLGAQQQLAQQAVQMRAADLQQAGMSAQLAYQQAALEAQQRGLNQQGQLGFEGLRQGVFQSQLSAQQAGEAQNQQIGLANAQLDFQRQQANQALMRQIVGGAFTAAGAVGGAMVGGPAGAMAGGAAGNAAGNIASNAVAGDTNPGTGQPYGAG